MVVYQDWGCRASASLVAIVQGKWTQGSEDSGSR